MAGFQVTTEVGRRKPALEADLSGAVTGESGAERCDRKQALKPAAKRELVAVLQIEHGLSERRACAAVGLDRSVYHYEPRPNGDGPIIKLSNAASISAAPAKRSLGSDLIALSNTAANA